MFESVRIPEVPGAHDERGKRAVKTSCPRCGYRLDGEIACWVDCCSLTSICAECGNDINWSHVLAPHKYEPRWSFEHAPRRRLAVTFVSTTLRLAVPKWFWTQLKMSDTVRPRRLAMYLGIFLVLVMVGWIAVQTAVAVVHWSDVQAVRVTLHAERAAMLMEPQRVRMAAMMSDGIRIRPEHLPTPWPIIVDGVTRPLGNRASYRITIDGEAWAVWDLGAVGRMESAVNRNSYAYGYGLRQASRFALSGLGCGLLAAMAIPISFVLLPWTRARCGVRWRHLVRIWVYAMPMMLLITVALIVFGMVEHATFAELAPVIYVLPVPMYIYIWWGRAMSRHLRLPRPWFVAGMLMVLSFLLLSLVVAGITMLRGMQ